MSNTFTFIAKSNQKISFGIIKLNQYKNKLFCFFLCENNNLQIKKSRFYEIFIKLYKKFC